MSIEGDVTKTNQKNSIDNCFQSNRKKINDCWRSQFMLKRHPIYEHMKTQGHDFLLN